MTPARILFRLAALGALALAIAAVLVEWLGARERPGKADVIVVLGAHVNADGTPSPRLAARLARGLEAWHAGAAPAIVVSGGLVRGRDEAAVMRAWLLARGVPDSVVTADPTGRNTWATARFVRGWLAARGGTSALAVSQGFHLPRCALAFRRWGIRPVPTAAARFHEWREIYSAPREVLGLIEYALRPGPRLPPLERRTP